MTGYSDHSVKPIDVRPLVGLRTMAGAHELFEEPPAVASPGNLPPYPRGSVIRHV